jgi:hypothetical protein
MSSHIAVHLNTLRMTKNTTELHPVNRLDSKKIHFSYHDNGFTILLDGVFMEDKVKINLSLPLRKYHAMKTCLLLD